LSNGSGLKKARRLAKPLIIPRAFYACKLNIHGIVNPGKE